MRKKQTRPLYIPKPEQGDFPFDYDQIDVEAIKQIDLFRMYNCMKMVVEKICPDQSNKLIANLDQIFKIFIEKDHNPPVQNKLVGRRNSPYTHQKSEFWDFVENLNTMGYTYKQISDKLQVHYVQISTHHRNGVKYDSEGSEPQSTSQKKQQKEVKKLEEVIDNQEQHEVFYSEDDQ